MFWYLLNIIIIVLVWLWPVNINCCDENTYCLYNKIRTKRTCIIGTINWIILSGFRSWEIGPDTLAYKLYRFDRTLDRSWAEIFADFVLKYKLGEEIKDPGYPVLEKIFQLFSSDYQLWLVAIAVMFFVPLGIVIYKYSTNAAVSYILFSTLFYSFFAMTGPRQTIATAIVVLIGIKYIKERKLIPFLLLELVASTIHMSALCFLPFYWLSKIKINTKSLTIYWIGIIVAYLGRNQFLTLLQRLIGYEEYVQAEGARAGTFLYLLILLAIIVTVFYQRFDVENQITRIAINALMIACVFSPLLLINQSCMRVIQSFSLFLLILLPDVFDLFEPRRSRNISIFIASALMIILLISNNPVYNFVFL